MLTALQCNCCQCLREVEGSERWCKRHVAPEPVSGSLRDSDRKRSRFLWWSVQLVSVDDPCSLTGLHTGLIDPVGLCRAPSSGVFSQPYHPDAALSACSRRNGTACVCVCVWLQLQGVFLTTLGYALLHTAHVVFSMQTRLAGDASSTALTSRSAPLATFQEVWLALQIQLVHAAHLTLGIQFGHAAHLTLWIQLVHAAYLTLGIQFCHAAYLTL